MSTRYTSLSLLLSIVDTLSLLLTSFTISLCAPYSCLYLILLDTLNSTRYFQLIARTSFGCSIVWALCLSWWAVPCCLSAYFLWVLYIVIVRIIYHHSSSNIAIFSSIIWSHTRCAFYSLPSITSFGFHDVYSVSMQQFYQVLALVCHLR